MIGYAFAFHEWNARYQDAGFTYPWCDWRMPSIRACWVYMNGPIAGVKVQQRSNPSVFGVVTRAGATVTVEYDSRRGRKSSTMSYSDFKLRWYVL